MSDFQGIIIIYSVFTILLVILFSIIFFIHGKKGKKLKKQEYLEPIIEEMMGGMIIVEEENKVLHSKTEEYVNRWIYEIAYNCGLRKAIQILMYHMNDE